jgi:benzoate/toluate 1,2-dioxygenase beta subunit
LIDITTNLRSEIEDFLYREARLLDERKYEEWLKLFSDDGLYWIQRWASENSLVENPEDELNILYLDRRRLEVYVRRILTGMAYTYEPHARTARILSNVMIRIANNHEFRVTCKFLLYLFRAQPHELYGPRMQETLAGDLEYVLKKIQGELKIKLKKVTPINETVIGGQIYVV